MVKKLMRKKTACGEKTRKNIKRQLTMIQESEVSKRAKRAWMAVHGKLLKTAEGTEDGELLYHTMVL